MTSSAELIAKEKDNSSQRIRKAVKVTIYGLIVNCLLVVFKILAGIFGSSSAMVADGLHSLSDSVSDVFLLFGFRFVNQPPDKKHNYGHGKVETLLTAVISIIVLLTGVYILINGSKLIFSLLLSEQQISPPNWIALSAALISILCKEILYHITKRTGKATNSDVLIANAWHHRTDSLSSVASFLGIGGAMLFSNQWVILDPIAAVIVSLFILAIGLKMLYKSIAEMLEVSIGSEKEKGIIKLINSVDGVIGSHKLKTRKIGNYFALDVHIEVNRYINIIQAHDIATQVEMKIREQYGQDNMISVHIEPFDTAPQA